VAGEFLHRARNRLLRVRKSSPDQTNDHYVQRFEQIIEEFGPALARTVASYERNATTQQDLLQEIRLALLRSLLQLKDPGKLRAFVFRVAHNCCVDHVVRHAGKSMALDDSAELQADDRTREHELLAKERTRRLVEAVRRLELPYRQVITLLLEDMSYVEIAESLGISVGNVGVRVNRAKARLKELLDHER
jgi:RNA polymerase sigma factor (sigma-70 family)